MMLPVHQPAAKIVPTPRSKAFTAAAAAPRRLARRRTHKQASFFAREGNSKHERAVDEEVQAGHFSARFTSALVADSQRRMKEGNRKTAGGSRATCLASMLVVVVTAVWTFVAYAIPLGDPFVEGRDLVRYYSYLAVAGFPCFMGTAHFFAAVVNVPVPSKRLLAAAVAGTVTLVVAVVILKKAFGIHPVPYHAITMGAAGCTATIGVIYRSYPGELRADPRFRRALCHSLGITSIMVLAAFGMVMFNTAFEKARGSTLAQSLLVIGLGVIKFALKEIMKRMANGGDHPDFAHLAALAVELEIACLCAVIFTSIDSLITFGLILAIDMIINLWYCVRITSVVINELRWRIAAQAKRFGKGTHLDDHGGDDDVLEAMANPRVAYLCAILYFTECTEVVGPVIMATCSLVIYYLVPNDNRNHITFMDERTGRTEADFVRGMTFVLVDAVVEGATFAVLVAFMRRVVHVDLMHVGWYLVTRHRAYVFWIHLCICIFFMCMFLRHNGCDTSLQFLWLSPEFSYDPSNQTHPVLWT